MADLSALAATAVPAALAHLHRSSRTGRVLNVELPPDLDLDQAVTTTGAGFALVSSSGTRLSLRRQPTLPDWVGPGLRALTVGLNPSLHAVEAGVGFAGPSNRFWPVVADLGLSVAWHDAALLLADGIGMTDLVKRATPRASEVRADEYRSGAQRLEDLVGWLQPRVVVFVGLSGLRAVRGPSIRAGPLTGGFGGRPAYVMPSTSGLNTHESREGLADHLRCALAVGGGR